MATAPINYNIDVANPVQNILGGFKTGYSIGALQEQQQMERERARAAAQAQAQMQTDLQAVAGNPNATGADYAGLITRYPQLSEQLKRGWDILDDQQRQSRLDQSGQVFAALQSGQPEIAKDLLKEIQTAAKNSGDTRTAASSEGLRRLIDVDPNAAKTATGLMLASQVGPEKFAEAFGKIGAEQRAQAMAPAELRRAEAQAGEAESVQAIKAAEAKTAPQKFALDLEQRGWDIKKIQEDIRSSKDASRLRAMEVALSRESNDLKRQELQTKIDEANQKVTDKMREKVASAESGAATIDNMLSTIERVAANPSLNDVLGSIEGRLPSVISDEGADAIALIDTLGSQAFLAQIPAIKGMGQLSDAEGKKLQSALTNLSRTQSESQFKANLKETTRLLNKARQNLSKSTGVPLAAPDVPSARTQPAEQQRNITVDF